MANHRSAIKAHEQSLRRRDRNNRMKSRMRRAIRATRSVVGSVAQDDDSASDARESIRATGALIDKLAGKGVIHRNAAARHKSRLEKRLRKASAPARDS